MTASTLIIFLPLSGSGALAEGKHEDLVVPSTDETVCVKQIQPIIDLWKNNARTIEDAKHLIEIQNTKGNCAAQQEYRKLLGFTR